MLTIVDLFYLNHVWGPTWIEIHWNSIWLRARLHRTSHYTWGCGDHTTWFWGCLGTGLGTLSFGLSQFYGYGSWLVCRALRWVPIPMPTHTHGFWVGTGGHGCDIIVHGWVSDLCIPASNSKSKSNFLDAGNTLTKKRSRLKPTTVNDLLFVRSNQDLV
jgi:hypothetical protein